MEPRHNDRITQMALLEERLSRGMAFFDSPQGASLRKDDPDRWWALEDEWLRLHEEFVLIGSWLVTHGTRYKGRGLCYPVEGADGVG